MTMHLIYGIDDAKFFKLDFSILTLSNWILPWNLQSHGVFGTMLICLN